MDNSSNRRILKSKKLSRAYYEAFYGSLHNKLFFGEIEDPDDFAFYLEETCPRNYEQIPLEMWVQLLKLHENKYNEN